MNYLLSLQRFLAFLLFFISTLTFSNETVKVLKKTSSLSFLELNIGEIDGFQRGDYGFLYAANNISDSNLLEQTKLTRVAKLSLAKSSLKSSLWKVQSIYQDEILNEKDSFLLFSRSRFETGRRDFVIRDKKIFLFNKLDSNNEITKYLDESKTGVPKEQLVLADYYLVRDTNLTANYSRDDGVDLYRQSFNKYQRNYNGDLVADASMVENSQNDSADLLSFKGKYKRKYFNSYLKNMENKSIGDQSNSSGINLNNPNLDLINRKQGRDYLNRSSVKKLDQEGYLWSSDMNDTEIRDFMVQSGLLEERSRKRQALTHSTAHEIQLSFHRGLSNQSSSESSSFAGTGFGLSFAYEFMLENIHPTIARLSLLAALDFSNNYFSANEAVNLKAATSSFHFRVNYYFYNYPSRIDDLIAFVGLGFKSGSAQLDGDDFERDYSFQASSLGSFHLGAKYRFNSEQSITNNYHFGFFSLLSYESLNFTSNEVFSELPSGDFVSNELNFSVGMSVYF